MILVKLSLSIEEYGMSLFILVFFFCSSVINFFSFRVKFTLGFLVFILIIVEYISFLKNYILRLILLAFEKAINFYRLKTGHLTEVRYGTSFCHSCLTCLDSVFSSVQSLSHVQLSATPWTTPCQASLSITNSLIYPSSCLLIW